jgi:hypothetical protein
MAASRDVRRAVLWIGVVGLAVGTMALAIVLLRPRPRAARAPETTITQGEMPRASARPTGAAPPACTTHVDCAGGALCTRGRCEPITTATTECRDVLIRFARGARELSSSAEAAVEGAARCLEANRLPVLRIEPSRERDRSTEANDELTNARVSLVRRALEQRGVAPDRVPELRLLPP